MHGLNWIISMQQLESLCTARYLSTTYLIRRQNELLWCIKGILLGDFRQVVLQPPPVAVVDACQKRSNIWHYFLQLRLTPNMRANDYEQPFSEWCLQLGNGTLSSALLTRFSWMIFLQHGSFVAEPFDECSSEEIEQRVILLPKNAEWLFLLSPF